MSTNKENESGGEDDSSLETSSCAQRGDDEEENDDKVPAAVNFSINIVITFALSLSIYLLMANVFLTFNKLSSLQWSKGGMLLAHLNDAGGFDKVLSSNGAELGSNSANGLRQVDKSYQYYDCSKSLLTLEECDLLNSYHDEYLNSLRSYLTRQSSGNEHHSKLQNSLKVNTSFFIH